MKNKCLGKYLYSKYMANFWKVANIILYQRSKGIIQIAFREIEEEGWAMNGMRRTSTSSIRTLEMEKCIA